MKIIKRKDIIHPHKDKETFKVIQERMMDINANESFVQHEEQLKAEWREECNSYYREMMEYYNQ